MIGPVYLSVLRRIHGKLSEENVNWAISLGIAFQSVPVEVHDIDIQTDERDAYKIEILFSEFVINCFLFCGEDPFSFRCAHDRRDQSEDNGKCSEKT